MANLSTHLKQTNSRLTKPRSAVFDYLKDHGAVPTRRLIADIPEVDRASIYRTLTLYRQTGVVQDIIAGGRRLVELTDEFDSHHHHLYCLGCGKSQVVNNEVLEAQMQAMASEFGFLPSSHQVEISGHCEDCRQSDSLPRPN